MREEFGDKIIIPENPEWDIGEGASLLALQEGCNHANQSIGMVLSDGSYYEFLAKNTELRNWKHKFYFGITDTTGVAQFVFDGKEGSSDIKNLQTRYRTLDVPAQGFLQEKIEVETSVDENLVFTVEAKSSAKSNEYKRIWQYENLKCYYKLPVEQK